MVCALVHREHYQVEYGVLQSNNDFKFYENPFPNLRTSSLSYANYFDHYS